MLNAKKRFCQPPLETQDIFSIGEILSRVDESTLARLHEINPTAKDTLNKYLVMKFQPLYAAEFDVTKSNPTHDPDAHIGRRVLLKSMTKVTT